MTLYEASDKLGGQLKHADYASFKWLPKHFKNFMIAQMDKLGVEVRLNTWATKELLAGQGYDVVVVAIGSTPTKPNMPGMDGANVHYASQIYGTMEDRLAEEIVMIGGGEIGVETAPLPVRAGEEVTVLEMLELIADAPHAHYKNMVHNYWRNQPNFHFQCGVTVTSIDPDGVNYTDWKENSIRSPAVMLLSIGTRPLAEEAMGLRVWRTKCLSLGTARQRPTSSGPCARLRYCGQHLNQQKRPCLQLCWRHGLSYRINERKERSEDPMNWIFPAFFRRSGVGAAGLYHDVCAGADASPGSRSCVLESRQRRSSRS